MVLISIEERVDLPSAAQLQRVPLVRKQDFGPKLLRRLWSERGGLSPDARVLARRSRLT